MQKHASEVYVSNNIEGISKVKQGNYAYLMEATTIEYNTERECNLTQIGGLLDSKGYGIAVRKGNTFENKKEQTILCIHYILFLVENWL